MLRNVLAFLISLSLALLLSEGILRLTHADEHVLPEAPKSDWAQVPERVWTRHHSVLGWDQEPGRSATLTSKNFEDVSVTIDENGLRVPSAPRGENDRAEKLALFMGDSFTFGFGVSAEAAFPYLVGEGLEDFHALNAGVPGYGIDQIYLLYREKLKSLKPAVVFIGVFPDDFHRGGRRFADSGHAKPYFRLDGKGELVLENVPVPQPYVLRTEQYPDIIEPRDWERPFLKSRLYRLVKTQGIRLGKNTGLLDPDLTPEWQLGKAVLRAFANDVKSSGERPVFILIPPSNWALASEPFSLEVSIKRFAAREGLELIDLDPVFREAVHRDGVETYYIEGDWHWNVQGHKLAAQTIVKYMKENPS